MQIQPLGGEDPQKEGMATHSSVLAWRIWLTEESQTQLKWFSTKLYIWKEKVDFMKYFSYKVIQLTVFSPVIRKVYKQKLWEYVSGS